MPPRSNLTSSFPVTDASNEVVCPLRNQDGSSCRKRCIGEKRYRSMQEHIRRAHPEHYIAKLPATEESFLLMISTSPSDRPQAQQQQQQQQPQQQQQQTSLPPPQAQQQPPQTAHHAKAAQFDYRRDAASAPGTPRRYDDYPGSSTLFPAAAALAQLHNHKSDGGWESDGDWHSDSERLRRPRSSLDLPPIQLPNADVTSAPLPSLERRDLLPSIMSHSPPGRSSTLPPIHRSVGPHHRSRKQSISKKHHRRKSKGPMSDWLRRIQNDSSSDMLRPGYGDRKALSAEPSSDYGKRWEDLIDAAASATEDIDDDRTPVSHKFASMLDPRLTSQMPQSPVSIQRSSLPPLGGGGGGGGGQGGGAFNNNYQASPLQRALTPPSYHPEAPEPFPSVESGESADTGYHLGSSRHGPHHRGGGHHSGLSSDASPSYSSQNTQIYCAACQGISLLRESYACTECICGLCQACVDVLMGEQGARRKCPRCATIGGRFKPFQLDIR